MSEKFCIVFLVHWELFMDCIFMVQVIFLHKEENPVILFVIGFEMFDILVYFVSFLVACENERQHVSTVQINEE